MAELRRQIVTERDSNGTPYNVELVDADCWHDSFLELDDDAVDVRVLRVREGALPDDLPRWLAAEPLLRGVAEVSATDGGGETRGAGLWPWSPRHREPGASTAEFMAVAISALRHPLPSPADERRRQSMVRTFAQSRPAPFAQIAALDGDELERWLQFAFASPDNFAWRLAVERIADDGSHEVASVLRFLADAPIPQGDPAYAELAVDQRVLREQASPWRYFEGDPFAGALRAAQAWRRRYQQAYQTHYREVMLQTEGLCQELTQSSTAAAALVRLNGIGALGAPAGGCALHAHAAATEALAAMPQQPDPLAARTADVPLGLMPEVFARARDAIDGVATALEVQRRRLASRTVHCVLEREHVPSLDRLLQAIVASDVGSIERALDGRLVAHIDRLLTAATETPVSAFVARFPRVSDATLNEAVETFRELLEGAIRASDDGHVTLGEPAPAEVA